MPTHVLFTFLSGAPSITYYDSLPAAPGVLPEQIFDLFLAYLTKYMFTIYLNLFDFHNIRFFIISSVHELNILHKPKTRRSKADFNNYLFEYNRNRLINTKQH